MIFGLSGISEDSMEDCIFCGLISGSLPCMKVFEDEYTLAFMDTSGDVDGHILVVPKKHTESILDCDEETLSRLMRTVRRVSLHLVEDCGYRGVNLLNASGESAGQSVPHFHIHLIPRRSNDGIDAWPRLRGAVRDVRDLFREISMEGE